MNEPSRFERWSDATAFTASALIARELAALGVRHGFGVLGGGIAAFADGLRKSPPTEAEIRKAKDSILNSFVFNYDSRDEVLSQQMLYAYHGLPADFLETYRTNVEKVGPPDVKRAIENKPTASTTTLSTVFA